MAHAYTPGLKVLHETKVLKERRLPLKGEVLVAKGAAVEPETVVAKTDLPGNVQMVNVANQLNADPSDVSDLMLIKEGGQISKGEVLAESPGIFGLFKSKVISPTDGTVESISAVTGQVVLREHPIPVEIDGYSQGTVKEVIPEEGVIVETTAAFIQGIFGIGGENRGILHMVVESRDEEITPDKITPDFAGKIIVGGSFISLETYQKAIENKVNGVVVGGFNYHDLKTILGYTLGVAITGSEDLATTLIVTEGYGKIRIGQRTFDLLRKHEGKAASINGATQIRAGVIRPEIVIPLPPEEITGTPKAIHSSEGIQKGSLVRIIRAPYFGRMGTVVALPSKLHQMESETMVRVAEVEIDGDRMLIPRANLEMVETDL
ncbi:MAG: hypothetical protein ACE5DP_01660 [Fidelibacterota bacterium]